MGWGGLDHNLERKETGKIKTFLKGLWSQSSSPLPSRESARCCAAEVGDI